MIAIALVLSLVQDTLPLSPRARAMLGQFAPPRAGDVSIATRFSRDTVWLGEQVELVTAAWFPRELRDRLRRPPTLRSPSLSGLWSVQSQGTPVLAATRLVGGQVYDLFIAHQTIFPLGEGTIQAPPATLSFAVPASTSYFAPENRRTLSSRAVSLVVRPIPASLAGRLGGGPTAQDIRVTWRAPAGGLRRGTPALVELVIAGAGNITLWPEPQVTWPAGLRVYAERTDEQPQVVAGRMGGEKRFRFTIVADSEGVVTLPRVRYTWFDPAAVQVHLVNAAPLTLPVVTGAALGTAPPRPFVSGEGTPVASTVRRRWWPLLAVLVLLPPIVVVTAGRRRPRHVRPPATDPEAELRRMLSMPSDTAPERVVAALRRRGVDRGTAESVRGWLADLLRHRYGRVTAGPTPAPGPLDRVLRVLRRMAVVALLVAGPVHAQEGSAADRYAAGDHAGAGRLLESRLVTDPDDAVAWYNLGAARAATGDDVGAAAAWVAGLRVAPRSPELRAAWRDMATLPADVRLLAPAIPVSRDEFVLIAVAAWAVGWMLRALRARRASSIAFACCAMAVAAALVRMRTDHTPAAIARGGAVLRVSPHPAAERIGDLAAWSTVDIDRAVPGWQLAVSGGRRGWVADADIARLGVVAR